MTCCPELDEFNRCQSDVVLPSGEQVIQDGSLTTGIQNYKEFFQSLAGLVGAGQNFTGNGVYTRFQPGGGAYPVRPATARHRRSASATPPRPGGGTRPARRPKPPYRPKTALSTQPVPDLNSAATDRTGRPVRRQIKKQARVFAAIIVLFVVAIGIAGYILSNQRFYLPAWVPVVGTDFYEVEAELPTAQAVVPGQGQTVNVAGVKVGEVGEVKLEDGRAVVTMQIKDKYKPIYKDATILLRPKTGLKDMILALDPGTREAGEVPEGGRVRRGQHAARREPRRGARRARRRHPRLPADPAERRRHGVPRRRPEARRAAARRTCARRSSASSPPRATPSSITGLLVKRRAQHPAASIHNFQRAGPPQLGARTSSWPRSWTRPTRTSRRSREEEASLREALRLFPGALSQTATTLATSNALANELGPTLEGLRPFARELAPGAARQRPFLRETTPIIRDQIRPFARDVAADGARPARRHGGARAGHAAPDAAASRSSTRSSTRWPTTRPATASPTSSGAAGRAHDGTLAHDLQDAHGPMVRGIVLLSATTSRCSSQLVPGNAAARDAHRARRTSPTTASSAREPDRLPPSQAGPRRR